MRIDRLRVPELSPAELSPRVLLASFMLEPPRSRFTRFPVPGLNLYLVTGGRMRYRDADGTAGIATAGDLVSFPYGYHEYEAMPDAPLAIYQTHFFAALPPKEHGIPALPPVGRLPLHLSVRERLADFAAVFQRLMQAVQDAAPAWEMEGAACVMELLHMAFRIAAGATQPVQKTLSPWDLVLVQLDREGDVMVRNLAANMGYSTEHFIREFRRRYGLPPKQYVLARRLERARQLLRVGGTVKAAAAACGFHTPLQLNRTHRRFYGHPPTVAKRAAGETMKASSEWRPGLTVCRHLWAPGVDMATLSAAMTAAC